jgi:hemerythrin-like metal-binding protein
VVYFEIFPWNQNFDTGIEIIDEQHKKLVDLVNKLAAHLANYSEDIVLNDIFDELTNYTHYHFESEQNIWDEYFADDEWSTIHDKTHDSFIDKIIAIKNDTKERSLDDVVYEIVSFLAEWLAYHILDTDKRYSIAVKQMMDGISMQDAKAYADEEMSGSMKTIVSTVLNMYNTLSTRTLDLMREKVLRQEAEKALIKAKQDAEKATTAKSEFLANMSHEIRTPLNAITGFVNILKDEDIGEKSLEYVNIIDRSSNSLLMIIEDILDFSKIESGKLNIDKIYFDPYDEFKIITDLFGGQCSQKGIIFNLNIDKTIPDAIESDPLRIKQVISNLLSNAIKFTNSQQNIFVNISYEDEILKISVKDEGKGIAENKLCHIFDAFTQEENSTTREYGGTGLGLAISSELVKLLGGELKVKSKLGFGSEFYFSIPAKQGDKISQNSSVLTDDFKFNNQRILLAEDNLANQVFMKVILKKMNLDFEIANNGQEVLDMFKNSKYDVILMDENMPQMNGIEATKRIIEYEKENALTHTPIIALTANALKGDKERLLNIGMDEYLTKPLDKNKLKKILSKFLTSSIA